MRGDVVARCSVEEIPEEPRQLLGIGRGFLRDGRVDRNNITISVARRRSIELWTVDDGDSAFGQPGRSPCSDPATHGGAFDTHPLAVPSRPEVGNDED